MSTNTARKGVLALASHTGWSLAEISDLTADELIEWVEAIPRPPK